MIFYLYIDDQCNSELSNIFGNQRKSPTKTRIKWNYHYFQNIITQCKFPAVFGQPKGFAQKQ